jgi:pyruvate, water dikinase
VRAHASIVSFSELPAEATALAGGKGASLARMSAAGLPVPAGFVVCASAFQSFLDAHDGTDLVRELTSNLDVHDASALDDVAARLRTLITGSALPADLRGAMGQAYEDLGRQPAVAVRSSAVSEDGEAASFAGQQETFLNVRGEEAVARQVQACWASFFAPRALFYRAKKGALTDTRMAVVVQEMVRADKSGVLFTIDPIRKRKDRMVIEAVFGLGEGIVSGEITPDHYVVDRETGAVVEEHIAVQPMAVMYDPQLEGTRHVELTEAEGAARVLDDDQLGRVHSMGLRVEEFFGAPQDVEWSFRNNELFLLQSRPVTTL